MYKPFNFNQCNYKCSGRNTLKSHIDAVLKKIFFFFSVVIATINAIKVIYEDIHIQFIKIYKNKLKPL